MADDSEFNFLLAYLNALLNTWFKHTLPLSYEKAKKRNEEESNPIFSYRKIEGASASAPFSREELKQKLRQKQRTRLRAVGEEMVFETLSLDSFFKTYIDERKLIETFPIRLDEIPEKMKLNLKQIKNFIEKAEEEQLEEILRNQACLNVIFKKIIFLFHCILIEKKDIDCEIILECLRKLSTPFLKKEGVLQKKDSYTWQARQYHSFIKNNIHPSLIDAYTNAAYFNALQATPETSHYWLAKSYLDTVMEMNDHYPLEGPDEHQTRAIQYYTNAKIECDAGNFSDFLKSFKKAERYLEKAKQLGAILSNDPSFRMHCFAADYCFEKKDFYLARHHYECALQLAKQEHEIIKNHGQDYITKIENLSIRANISNIVSIREKLTQHFPEATLTPILKTPTFSISLPIKDYPRNKGSLQAQMENSYVKIIKWGDKAEKSLTIQTCEPDPNAIIQAIQSLRYKIEMQLHLEEQGTKRFVPISSPLPSLPPLPFPSFSNISVPTASHEEQKQTKIKTRKAPAILPLLEDAPARPLLEEIENNYGFPSQIPVIPLYRSKKALSKGPSHTNVFVAHTDIPSVSKETDEAVEKILTSKAGLVRISLSSLGEEGIKIKNWPEKENWEQCILYAKLIGKNKGSTRIFAHPKEKIILTTENGKEEERYLYSFDSHSKIKHK